VGKFKMRILITAGTTHEHIDPIRFISNASSGLQGVLLAQNALLRGHEIILIIGPNSLNFNLENPKLKIINIVSAEDMYNAAMDNFSSCDAAICAAAVGDYRVKNIASEKIKRNGDSILLELIPNPDIAKSLGEIKTKQTLIGFALETNNGIENAKSKIIKKNLDFIVLNQTSDDNPAFGADTNIVSIIDKQGNTYNYPKLDKSKIAEEILNLLNI